MNHLDPLLSGTGFDESTLAIVIGVTPQRARAILAGRILPTAIEIRAIAAALQPAAVLSPMPMMAVLR